MILCSKYIIGTQAGGGKDCAVAVRDGRIVEVGRSKRIGGEGDVVDLGDCVLMPGMVNAHTHMELGFARGRVPPSKDFAGWLGSLLAEIRSAGSDEESVTNAVRDGLTESMRSGVTLIGDITRQPNLVRGVLAEASLRPTVRSYGEVIATGTQRDQASDRIAAAVDRQHESQTLGVGISPHAPYTVEPAVLARCVDPANRGALPICIHAAETKEEEEFTCRGTGPLREHLVRAGVWDDNVPVIGRRPIEYLQAEGALANHTLLAHCNYLTDEDIRILKQTNTHVVYCPRTHAAFGHPPHPVDRLLKARVRVCLGTDSLASSPSLSILEEMRFLYSQRPDLPPHTILAMGTTHGALALCANDLNVGPLIGPGFRADLVAIQLDPSSSASPEEQVVGGTGRVRAVFIGGKRVDSSMIQPR